MSHSLHLCAKAMQSSLNLQRCRDLLMHCCDDFANQRTLNRLFKMAWDKLSHCAIICVWDSNISVISWNCQSFATSMQLSFNHFHQFQYLMRRDSICKLLILVSLWTTHSTYYTCWPKWITTESCLGLILSGNVHVGPLLKRQQTNKSPRSWSFQAAIACPYVIFHPLGNIQRVSNPIKSGSLLYTSLLLVLMYPTCICIYGRLRITGYIELLCCISNVIYFGRFICSHVDDCWLLFLGLYSRFCKGLCSTKCISNFPVCTLIEVPAIATTKITCLSTVACYTFPLTHSWYVLKYRFKCRKYSMLVMHEAELRRAGKWGSIWITGKSTSDSDCQQYVVTDVSHKTWPVFLILKKLMSTFQHHN